MTAKHSKPMRSAIMRKISIAAFLSTSLVAPTASIAFAAPPASDSLRAGFINPPNSAHPRVWWHWMNGNVTKDGIQKDLQWMKRVGVGGVQNFDVSLFSPQVVQKRLAYMTPEWKDAFKYAVVTADQLGLTYGIAGSPGWSESGAPWVAPKDGMKKFVWSETVVEGGRPFNGALPQPPSVTGAYQNLPMPPDPTAALNPGAKPVVPPTYYGDAAVFAYPLPDIATLPQGNVQSGDGKSIDPKLIADFAGPGAAVPAGSKDAPGSVVISYTSPQTVRSATVFVPGGSMIFIGPVITPVLEAQGEDGNWHKVTDVTLGGVPTTVSFAPVTAKQFRLVLYPAPPSNILSSQDVGVQGVQSPMAMLMQSKPSSIKVSLFQLSAESKVNRFEAKAGFTIADDYYALDSDAGADVTGIAPRSVIDLSGKMQPDGNLDWTPPPGRWKIVRLGYSLEGTTNHPATPESTGLEVDEYDAAAVRTYSEKHLGTYEDILGSKLMGKTGLHEQINDSTEVGPSNWTPALLDRFQHLRGYDPRPWLPVLTGEVVGSRTQSDAFLYDFRHTLADLVATEHYKTIASVVHEHGMIEYGEALENGRPSLGDDMEMRRYTDVPMSALWAYNPAKGPNPDYIADMKGASSVAHIYGQNLTAAESMTAAGAPWAFAPSDLKPYIDIEFASGVNHPSVHSSVHQPLDNNLPGMALMIFGQYFNRLDSWAEMAKPWTDYIARSCYLLAQGRNVADVAYFYGEEAPLTALYNKTQPGDAPTHYAFDYVNANAVTQALKVDGHVLVTPGGARYRVLYLGGTNNHLTVPVLERLVELAKAGATIVGNPPQSTPSLKDDPAAFSNLVKQLWSGAPVTHIGQGQVIAGNDVEAALQSTRLGPDFRFTSDAADSQVLFLHRQLKDGDAYFVDNRKARAEHLEAHFRVTGKAPALWYADTGKEIPASYRIENGETVVPLDMEANEAVFVVFRTPAKTQSRTVPITTWTPIATINGGWDLAFEPNREAPPAAHFDTLHSLTESTDPGVKYFSGTVAYKTNFTLSNDVKPGASLMLDLGKVGDIAEVSVNGRPVGYIWKAPYRLDIGKAVKAGQNTLEIKVADLWVNRLIGDAQPGATPITHTALLSYQASAPLRPSGLIGPVTIMRADR